MSFEQRPIIRWNLCKDGNPPANAETTYLVTYVEHHDGKTVHASFGKYAPPCMDDTMPQEEWVVLVTDNLEDNSGSWEPPCLWNCSVIAWAEIPRPFIGENQ